MSLLQNSNVVTPSGYNIDYSMRMPDATSSAKLYRVLDSAGSVNPKWTFATWYKKGSPTDSVKALYGTENSPRGKQVAMGFQNDVINYGAGVRWHAGGQWDWDTDNNAGTNAGMAFRDYTDWFHFCHIIDYSTSPYVFLYMNGVLQDPNWIYGGKSGPGYATNYSMVSGDKLYICCSDGSDTGNGYFADTYWIEGQNLPPIGNFLEIDDLTNQTLAIKYPGTYTGNSVYFDYADSSDFGKDQSGLGNDFTSTSLGTQEQTIDTPQNNVGSNFAVWNPLWGRGTKMPKLTRGCRGGKSSDAAQTPISATFGNLVDGKWYWEILPDSKGGSDCKIGVLNTSGQMTDVAQANHYYRLYLADTGNKFSDTNASTVAYGNTYTQGDIIGIALDMDNGALYFSKNGTWQDSGVPTSGATKTGAAYTDVLSLVPDGGKIGGDGWVPYVDASDTTVEYICNFGQDSSFDGTKTSGSAEAADGGGKGNFYYTPPSGYIALCQDNLPTPSIKLPGSQYKTALYAGTGSELSVSSLDFQPDFTWIKARQQTYYHRLFDVLRGVTNEIYTYGTAIQTTDAQSLKSFDSDGFTLGTSAGVNPSSSSNMVSFNWKGGGAGVANTDGTIASTVSANPTAGFSVVKYTGTAANATVGHGLSQAPEMVLVRNYSNIHDWQWYMKGMGPTKYMSINSSAAPSTSSTRWNDTSPTASVFHLGNSNPVNQSGDDIVAYCFHSVPGYCKVGQAKLLASSPSGNDGTYIYLGFKPAFFMWKYSTTTHACVIYDRSLTYGITPAPHNVGNVYTVPNATYTDQISINPMIGFDYLSNGVKQRQDFSADTMQYIAFAAWPFKYSRGDAA